MGQSPWGISKLKLKLCMVCSQYEVSLLLGDTDGQLEVLERSNQGGLAALLRSSLPRSGLSFSHITNKKKDYFLACTNRDGKLGAIFISSRVHCTAMFSFQPIAL